MGPVFRSFTKTTSLPVGPPEDNRYKKQILLDNVQNIQWVFYDTNLGQYTNWPPTQDWAYTTPIAIKLTLKLNDFGTIEKTIDMANHE